MHSLEIWAAKYIETSTLSWFEGGTIGVDAGYYLNSILNTNVEEPLKAALGGLPFSLTTRVEDDIAAAKEAGCKLLFVFDGLSFVNKAKSGAESAKSRKAHEDGWQHYSQGDSRAPVTDFGRADFPAEVLERQLRKILYENGVDYVIAPFSAVAQLAYLSRCPGQPIDGVMASTDAFLFDVNKVILTIDRTESMFSWLDRSRCEHAAACTSSDQFKEAQLLLGSAFLPIFPPLAKNPNANVRDALAMLSRAPSLQLFHQHRNEAPDYADRYKKAVMTIRYHVVMTADGHVQPTALDRAPGDVHAFIGFRMPDELNVYLWRGLTGPQIMDWISTREIDLALPGGVQDCEPYRKLVIRDLEVLRFQSIRLLSQSMNRYYQTQPIKTRTWTGQETSNTPSNEEDLKAKVSTWRVPDNVMPSTKQARQPSVHACLKVCMDKDFARKSISKARTPYFHPHHPALTTLDEVLSNAYWRFLHIRGFINDKHELTTWGLMLEATLATMENGSQKEEQALLLVEMLRYGLFNTDDATGTAVPSTDPQAEYKRHTNLLSKIACVGRLKHEPVGYVGALDRPLLTLAWQITALRQSLRDLLETCLVTMFLDGDVSRDRDDWIKLAQQLPLSSDNGAGLGLCVKIYLEALAEHATSPESMPSAKEKIKNQSEFNYFSKLQDKSLHSSLSSAWELFDAVHAAAKVGGKEVKELAVLDHVAQWIESRR